MTTDHKRVVLEKYPEAYCTGIRGLNGKYISRTTDDDKLVLNGGATESEAWANVAKKIQETGK